MTVSQHHPIANQLGRAVEAAVGVVVAVLVTALPASWALMVAIDGAGGSLSYRAALPLGTFVGLVPLAVAAAMARSAVPAPAARRPGTTPGRTRWARPAVPLVVGTGVDPVTFRFSGGRSAN